METLGSLELRKFRTDPNGQVVESTKSGAKEAVHISLPTYLQSKPYFSQNRVQIVPFNGQEVLMDILDKAGSLVPGDLQYGSITVYKSHLDVHGYVEKHSNSNRQYPLLVPETPVTEIAFERIIAKLPLFGDDKYQATLAVKWEPNYCQVALGLNVNICDNWNIFAPRVWNTGMKISYESLMVYVENELSQLERHFGADVQTIQSLVDTPMNDRSMRLLVGDMHVRYAEGDTILNVTDINEVVRSIVQDKENKHEMTNLWDFCMHGTKALHFNKNSGDSAIETVARFNKYVLEVQTKSTARRN